VKAANCVTFLCFVQNNVSPFRGYPTMFTEMGLIKLKYTSVVGVRWPSALGSSHAEHCSNIVKIGKPGVYANCVGRGSVHVLFYPKQANRRPTVFGSRALGGVWMYTWKVQDAWREDASNASSFPSQIRHFLNVIFNIQTRLRLIYLNMSFLSRTPTQIRL
jgi:hypothetical protein